MLKLVCAKTRMLWVLPTAPKRSTVRIIRFILTKLMNEQHPRKRVRVDEDIALASSTDVTNLLVDEFKISVETTGGDAYGINGKNGRYNRSIQNMVISDLLDINQHGNKWCCAAEISAEVHKCRIHSALYNISPQFAWYGKNTSIQELRTFGCDIYPITSSNKELDEITQEGSFMGYTNSRATMKWWDPHTKRLT